MAICFWFWLSSTFDLPFFTYCRLSTLRQNVIDQDGAGEYVLRWYNHNVSLIKANRDLLSNATLTDCTLAAEGQFLGVHQLVLSACNPYFEAILNQMTADKHPIIVLKDISFCMYKGTLEQVPGFLGAALSLYVSATYFSCLLNFFVNELLYSWTP
jgi:hypothetical protein